MGFLGSPPGSQGRQEIDPLGSTKKFNGKDAFHILQDLTEFQSGTHSHADMVFFVSRGRNGVD